MTFKFDIINIQKKELSTLQFSQHYQKKLGSYIYGNGKWWLCYGICLWSLMHGGLMCDVYLNNFSKQIFLKLEAFIC